MAVYQEKNKNKQTKDGRSWYFRVYYTTLSGKTKQKESKKYMTKKEALNEERKFLLSTTNQIDNKDMRFKDLYTLYYDHQKTKVKSGTFQTYKDRQIYLEMFDNVKCVDVSINHYDLWRKNLENKPLSIGYKNDIQKFLKAILNYGMEWQGFNFNNVYKKMEKFKDPNEIPKEMEFYTYEEFKKFISYEKSLFWRTLFETLYYCGLRNGEMRGLTWEDIDFKNKTMRINKQIPTKISSRNWEFTSLKSKSSIRTLPICETLLNDLKELHNEVTEYNNFNEKWFVFGNVLPIVADNPNEHQKTICDLSNVKKIRIHDFRHSCASLLISNGADITIVAKYLGHAKIDETLQTYSHMFESKLNDIVTIINRTNNITDIFIKDDENFADKINNLVNNLFSSGLNSNIVTEILTNIEKTLENKR